MEPSDLYNNYSEINSNIHVFDRNYYEITASEYDEMYSEYMPKNKEAKILDIGCGNGIFLYYLKKYGYVNNMGIDVDKSSVDIVKENVTENVSNTDAFAFLNNFNKEYDMIIMNEVLEHINKEQIIPLIKLIYSSLSKGGIFIAYVPNMENPFTIYTRYNDFTHTIGYTQNSLTMVLKLGGFSDIVVKPTTSKKRTIKKYIKHIIQKLTKQFLVTFFEYPKNGFLNSMRIYSIAKK